MSFLTIPLRRAVLNTPKCLRAPVITTFTPRPFSTTPTPATGVPAVAKKGRKARAPDPRAHDFIKFIAANLGYTDNPKAKATVVVGGELAEQEPWIVQLAVKLAKLYGVQNCVVGKNGKLSARRANKIKKDLSGNGCILIVKKLQGRKKNPVLDEDGKMVPTVEVNMCYAHFHTPDELTAKAVYHDSVTEIMPSLETAVLSMPDIDISRIGDTKYFGMDLSVVEGDTTVKLRRMTRDMQAAHKKEKDRSGPGAAWMGRGSKAGIKRYADKNSEDYDMSKPPVYAERSLRMLLEGKRAGSQTQAQPSQGGTGLKGLLDAKRAKFFEDKTI